MGKRRLKGHVRTRTENMTNLKRRWIENGTRDKLRGVQMTGRTELTQVRTIKKQQSFPYKSTLVHCPAQIPLICHVVTTCFSVFCVVAFVLSCEDSIVKPNRFWISAFNAYIDHGEDLSIHFRAPPSLSRSIIPLVQISRDEACSTVLKIVECR